MFNLLGYFIVPDFNRVAFTQKTILLVWGFRIISDRIILTNTDRKVRKKKILKCLL